MAAVVDLNGIKESIQNLLLAANTSTASPINLSAGLTATCGVVQRIWKINPEKIIPQPSIFPLVTCYVTDKTIKQDQIAKDQLSAKRRATVSVDIVGTIWNSNIVNIDEDPADENINTLMENVELVLRSDFNLGGTVNWQRTTGCKFYTSILNEQTHLRSGILKLECEVFY